jgi:hypothetical protein
MPDIHAELLPTDRLRQIPSIVPSDSPPLSDEDCLIRLARVVAKHDAAQLEEVARLIGRLVVTIE